MLRFRTIFLKKIFTLKNSILARRGAVIFIVSAVFTSIMFFAHSWASDKEVAMTLSVLNSNEYNFSSTSDVLSTTRKEYEKKHALEIKEKNDKEFEECEIQNENSKLPCLNGNEFSVATQWKINGINSSCNEYDMQGDSDKGYDSESQCKISLNKWLKENNKITPWHIAQTSFFWLDITGLLFMFGGFLTTLFAGMRALWGKSDS